MTFNIHMTAHTNV